MTWEWSHTQEAYDDLREHLLLQDRKWLETVYAEWKAKPGGHFKPGPLHSITFADFDDRRYERALSAAKYMSTDYLAERIFDLAERQSDCTNGGHEAHCCPYHCVPHTIDWSPPKEEEIPEEDLCDHPDCDAATRGDLYETTGYYDVVRCHKHRPMECAPSAIFSNPLPREKRVAEDWHLWSITGYAFRRCESEERFDVYRDRYGPLGGVVYYNSNPIVRQHYCVEFYARSFEL